MHILFVCIGNSYRSRIAEAYAKAHLPEGFTVSSAGTLAYQNHNGPSCWYANRVLARHGLSSFMSPTWTQLSQPLLSAADYTIFVHPLVEDQARASLTVPIRQTATWNIPDVETTDDEVCIPASEQAYIEIAQLIDQLIVDLGSDGADTPPLTQTVSGRNLAGKEIDIPTTSLYFRPSVYGICRTDDQLLVIENPRTGAYSLPGGGVGLSETLPEALRRELREEAGLVVLPQDPLFFLETFFYHDEVNDAFHGFNFVYECSVQITELSGLHIEVEGKVVEQARWVPLAALTPDHFQGTHGQLFSRYIALKQPPPE